MPHARTGGRPEREAAGLGPLPLAAAAAAAPTTPGVYFLFAEGGELLYVGKSGNLRRRLQQHLAAGERGGRREAARVARTHDVRWEEWPDEESAPPARRTSPSPSARP